MNGDCGFCLSPGVWLLQKKFQTLTCTCKRVYLFIYIHSFTISFQWCYCCIKWHYSGSKQLFKQLGFLRAMVCLSLQLYCFTKAESKQDLWERERERQNPHEREGRRRREGCILCAWWHKCGSERGSQLTSKIFFLTAVLVLHSEKERGQSK